jgi:beta-xylosidase
MKFLKKLRSRTILMVLTLLPLPILIQAQNPIIPDMIADPSIVKFGDTYYCYATTDGYGRGLATSGPPVVWKSKDFVHWSFNGIAFPSMKNQVYWAPSKAVEVSGKYYLYPTLNANIYCAVSNSPDGPFRLANGADTLAGQDAPKPMVCDRGPRNSKGIDAEIFTDDDGQSYMFWAQRGVSKLNKDWMTLDTVVHIIDTKRRGYSEGPIFFKRKGLYYYLYTMDGHENYKYAYVYSRKSPIGPFEYPEKDVISSTSHTEGIYGPGHGCVFNEPGTDNYYFVYLEFGIGGTNRQVWADKLTFNEDGTIVPVTLTKQGVGALVKNKTKTNIALGKTAIASSTSSDFKVKPIKDPLLVRIETYDPKNALDGSNGTRWMAAAEDSAATFTIDLGLVRKIRETNLYFNMPTAGHAYRLESSIDGRIWLQCGGHTDLRIQSPHRDHPGLRTRFLKVIFLKGSPGIWEMQVH